MKFILNLKGDGSSSEDESSNESDESSEHNDSAEESESSGAEDEKDLGILAKITKIDENMNVSIVDDIKKIVVKETEKIQNTNQEAKVNRNRNRPKIKVLIMNAIRELKEHGGSSMQAIVKYIKNNYEINDERRYTKIVSRQIKMAVQAGELIQLKRHFKVAPDLIKKHRIEEKMLAKKAKELERLKAKEERQLEKEKLKKKKQKEKEKLKKMDQKTVKQSGKTKGDIEKSKDTKAAANKSTEKSKLEKPVKTKEPKAKTDDGLNVNSKVKAAPKTMPKSKSKRRKSIGTLAMAPAHPKPTKNAVKKLVGGGGNKKKEMSTESDNKVTDTEESAKEMTPTMSKKSTAAVAGRGRKKKLAPN